MPRGRPKGSLNKKTLLKLSQQESKESPENIIAPSDDNIKQEERAILPIIKRGRGRPRKNPGIPQPTKQKTNNIPITDSLKEPIIKEILTLEPGLDQVINLNNHSVENLQKHLNIVKRKNGTQEVKNAESKTEL